MPAPKPKTDGEKPRSAFIVSAAKPTFKPVDEADEIEQTQKRDQPPLALGEDLVFGGVGLVIPQMP